jgi:hypothetical protein
MTLVLLLSVLPARALAIPPGWTAVEPTRAVRVPGEPGLGEVLELGVPGGTGVPAEVLEALAARGVTATLAGTRSDGTLDLTVERGTTGVASVRVEAGCATWTVVTAAPGEGAGLDVHAVLTAASAAGGPAPVGHGDALWAQATPPVPSSVAPWGDAWSAPPGTAWALAPDLVGLWAGRRPRTGVEVVLFLDPNGRARLEQRGDAGTSVQEGTWAVQGGELKVDLLTGEAWTTPYTAGPGTLSVVVDRQPVVLVRRR